MKNSHLARLDRQIRLRGEEVQLRRTVGTNPNSTVRVNTRGLVRTFAAEQLIAGLSQTNYLIILSPTLLRLHGWPGGRAVVIDPGFPPGTKDDVIPLSTDVVFIRQAQKSISRVDAKFDGDEVIRIELNIIG